MTNTTALEPMPGFLFGADPEFFLRDIYTSEFVPACNYLPGTKSDPYSVDKGAIQVDGMAGEINIDPVDNYKEFRSNLTTVLKKVRTFLPSHVEMVYTPTATFTKKAWDETPDEFKELGCSPDFNAWTGDINPAPKVKADSRTRHAGGHLHIGWGDGLLMSDEGHVLNCRDLVQQLDFYLGAWSITKDPHHDRRQQYGKAGACRIKPYGVEYRVLSNFWLGNGATTMMVWDRLQMAIKRMRDGFLPEYMTANPEVKFGDLVVKSINDGKLDNELTYAFKNPILVLNKEN